MGVPKKRKKLDITPNDSQKDATAKKTNKIQTEDLKQNEFNEAADTISSEKLDKALEIVDNIDKGRKEAENKAESQILFSKNNFDIINKEPFPLAKTQKRPGLRFRISLDALIPEDEEFNEYRDKKRINKEAIIDLGITIPFIWEIPVVGTIAKKIVKRIVKLFRN